MSDKLAIEGGKPEVPEKLVSHDWERYKKATDEEIEAVTKVLKSGHLSIAAPRGMPQADALEREFAEWNGSKYCLAVHSGTAALHCAVAGVGVRAGDEVIVPAYTFVASAMAVLHHNAIPVFVDVDPKTYLLDPAKIEDKLSPRTKAIMVVHILGLPGDMNEINDIAKRHNLMVIEDSAQAYGPTYDGRKTGTLGHVAGFAMTTTKQLMTGEGGLLTTNSQEIFERAAMLRLFGEPGSALNAQDRKYMSETVGWNYKLPEVSSALARVRLKYLHRYIKGIQKNAEYLSERIGSIAGLSTPEIPEGRTHSYCLYTLQVDPAELNLNIEAGKLRRAVMNALSAENVDVMGWQKVPVPAQPVFQRKSGYGRSSPWDEHSSKVNYSLDQYPNTFKVIENSFTVRRLVPPNDFELMDHYAKAMEKVFAQIDRVVELFDEMGGYIPLEERLASLSS